MKKFNCQFLILGSGVAGLGASIALEKMGRDSLILEKENTPGGLNKNITVAGCDFDFGPKILLLDDSPNSKEMLSFLGNNYQKYPVVESTYLSKYGLLGFPLQRYLIDLPQEEQRQILVGLKDARKLQRSVRSFKDWLINGFGEYFCKLVLFPYEKKKWQIDLDKMDYQWALNRPIKVDFNEIISGLKKRLPPNRFYFYPKKGNISMLTQGMVKKASKILTSHEVIGINLKEKYVDTPNGRFYYQFLISSLPLDYIVQITADLPFKLKSRASRKLKRLSILVFNLVFKGKHNLNGTAIYFPEQEFVFRRVSILQNLCPALGRDNLTPVSVEMSVSQKDINKINEVELLNKIMANFKNIPEFEPLKDLLEWEMLKVDFAYPQQLNGLNKMVGKIQDYYRQFDVYHCGRGGNFDYCNSDQAYKQGKEIVQQIIN